MLGPSGSGKTTVLRMVAGFEPPTAGRVLLGETGRHPRAAVHARRQHGLPGLRPVPAHERAAERRVRPAGSSGSAAAERRRRARGGAGDRPARRLRRPSAAPSSPEASGSGSRSPAPWSTGRKVLLLDEPLGALDLKLRREMQIELKQIQREVGITFVFVTHDQEEALTLSDRIAVFNEGRVEQVGTSRRALRAARPPVRRRVRRHLQPARGRRRRAACVGERGHVQHPPGEDPPATRRPAPPSATTTASRARHGRRRRLPRVGDALRRRPRRRTGRAERHAAEPARAPSTTPSRGGASACCSAGSARTWSPSPRAPGPRSVRRPRSGRTTEGGP